MTRSTSRIVRLLAAVAIIFTLAFVNGATHSYALSGTTFEGADGNLLVTQGGTDWCNQTSSAACPSSNLAPSFVGKQDLPSGSADDSFGQGSKEDISCPTEVFGSIPPNKSDLTRFYTAHEQVSGNTYLYLAWERTNQLGNANMDFEFNQSKSLCASEPSGSAVPVRTNGDMLVTYDFGGSGAPALGLNFWLVAGQPDPISGNPISVSQCFSSNSLPCWGDHQALNGTNSEGGVNTSGTVTDPINCSTCTPPAPNSLIANTFGEASINLSTAVPNVFGSHPTTCESFGSAYLKSRSASSFTAEQKDFVSPATINLPNCGSITIHKVTENGDGTFNYTTTGGLSPSTFKLSNGGTQPYTNVLAGNYSVTESTLPSGWTLKNLACGTVSGTGTSASISGATLSITMAAGGIVDCTYTNHTNVTPTISTTLSKTTVGIGDPVHDSATLTGATSNAGGTVTYTAYSDSGCSQNAQSTGTKTVTNGVVPDSDAISFSSAGDYYWQAVYSGDANNNGNKSTCTDEHLVVQASPTVKTSITTGTIDVNGSDTDKATLSGTSVDTNSNLKATGTVTFTVYNDNSCTTKAVAGTDIKAQPGTVNLNSDGLTANSPSVQFLRDGDFYWVATYNGDTYNKSTSSGCADEHEVVKAKPGINTTLSKTSVAINDTFHDSANLTSASTSHTPTGSVTYYWTQDSSCAIGNLNQYDQVTLNADGSVPSSKDISFANAGTYYFVAVYGGDGYNESATSACQSEVVTVNPNQPKMTTAQKLIPNDSATLTGLTSDATGTVTFQLFSSSDCSGTPIYSSPAISLGTVSGGSATVSTNNTSFYVGGDSGFGPGTYNWLVTFNSSNSNDLGTTLSCGTEHFSFNS